MNASAPRTDNKVIRIGVFYDGGYFARVSNYYRFHDPRRSRLSIMGLHDYVRQALHEFENVDKRCKSDSQRGAHRVENHFRPVVFTRWVDCREVANEGGNSR